MRFERLLLLWDELDELAGALRHGYLHLAHELKGLGQDVAGRVRPWAAGEGAQGAAVLPETSPET